MLKSIHQEPSKRPKHWATRPVHELTCDHRGFELEKKYTNNKVLISKHFCYRKSKHESQSFGLMNQITQNYTDFLVQRGKKMILREIKPAIIAALEVNLLKFEAAKLWRSSNNVIFSYLDEIAMPDLNARFSIQHIQQHLLFKRRKGKKK